MLNKLTFKKAPLKNILKQFIKFGLVGVLNTLLTLCTIFVLMNSFSISYKLSNFIGYILGFINSFVLNKFWTFQSKSRSSIVREALLFTVIFAAAYGMEYKILVYLNESLKITGFLAQVAAAVPYTVVSFILNRLFTFKKRI